MSTPSDVNLAAFLAERELPCPSCGKSLRGVAAPACPSCSFALSVPSLLASRSAKPPVPILFVRVLSIIAMLVAGYLAFTGITNSQPAGCSPGAGCGDVLSSPWSSLWGVPVSVPGFLVYLGLFLCTFHVSLAHTDLRRRDAWMVLVLLAVFAGLGAAWFIYLQLLKIKSICPYCMIDHACGLLIAALVLFSAPIRRGEPLPGGHRSVVVLGATRARLLITMGIMIMGLFTLAQLMFPASTSKAYVTPDVIVDEPEKKLPDKDAKPPVVRKDGGIKSPVKDGTATKDPSKDDTKTAVKDGAKDDSKVGVKDDAKTGTKDGATTKLIVDGAVWLRLPKGPPPSGLVKFQRDGLPMRGDLNAKVVLVCMVDYTCPHCRAFHHLFPKVRERYGDQIAFMIVPMPLNPQCNPYLDHLDERHAAACDLARLSLAVWKTDAKKFPEFDDWLFAPEKARSAAESQAKAEELVGKVALKATFDTGWPHEQALKHVRLYNMAGLGRIPKVMFENRRLEGGIAEADFWSWLEGEDGPGVERRK